MSNQIPVPEDILEYRANFIRELRSGKYKQNRCNEYYNEETGAYCVLGIAGHVIGFRVDEGESPNTIEIAEDLFIKDDDIDALISMNDDKKMSFNEIADALEDGGFLDNKDYRKPENHLFQ